MTCAKPDGLHFDELHEQLGDEHGNFDPRDLPAETAVTMADGCVWTLDEAPRARLSDAIKGVLVSSWSRT